MMVTDDHRTFHAAPRKSLLDILGGSVDQGHHPKTTIIQTQDPGVSDPSIVSPTSASSSKLALPRPESRLNSVSRQLSVAVDVHHGGPPSPRTSVAPESHTHEPDSDMSDLHADPASPPRSPLSLFTDLSDVVRESAELDRITSLHHLLTAERDELLTRHEETTRALSRAKTQLDRVLSLADEAIQMTTVFVDKEKTRLEIKKTKAEANIERRKNFEAEQRRKAKELERFRQREEERKALVEMEQRAERQRLEEQRRKEEALEAERRRQDEIQARERAQAEERHRLEEERSRVEEEERHRLAEEDRRRRDEEERKRQAEDRKRRAEEERVRQAEEERRRQAEEERKRQVEEERQKEEEEERLRRQLAERDALARKQEEDRRIQLFERRRLAEDDRRRKEAETAAARAEAEKQAAEKEQQRIFQERRATALKDKYRNHSRPEPGAPLTGPSSSDLPLTTANGAPTNPQAVSEQHLGIIKTHRTHDTPTFVPATTEAGKLPPDLSQQFRAPNSLVDHAVKDEATSPVLTPIDDVQPMEDTPPSHLPSRPASSTSAHAPTPVSSSAPPHLPARPVKTYPQPPVSTSSQQRGRSPRHHPPRRSRSRSRSSPRSSRRGSPMSRIASRNSRSPDSARDRHYSPPAARSSNHPLPRPPHRGGGTRYNRDSRSHSPPPPPPPPPPLPNSRKRVAPDSWVSADTPRKLDYSHPAKRRAVSPLRSRSPPSPRSRPLTRPPPVVSARHQPQPNRRGKGGGGSSHLPLEQRLSDRPPPPPLMDRLSYRDHS